MQTKKKAPQQWYQSTLHFLHSMSAIILWGASSHKPGTPAEPGDSGFNNRDETASSSGEGELKQAEGVRHTRTDSWDDRGHESSQEIHMDEG